MFGAHLDGARHARSAHQVSGRAGAPAKYVSNGGHRLAVGAHETRRDVGERCSVVGALARVERGAREVSIGALFSDSTVVAVPVDYAIYPPGRITPIWSIHTGDIIVGYRHEGGMPGFLRFPLECEGEAYDEGLSYAQALVAPLAAIWEREGAGDARVREAAALLQFGPVDELIESLERTPRATSAAHDQWYSAFLKALPKHPDR